MPEKITYACVVLDESDRTGFPYTVVVSVAQTPGQPAEPFWIIGNTPDRETLDEAKALAQSLIGQELDYAASTMFVMYNNMSRVWDTTRGEIKDWFAQHTPRG
jgi:hypothetical protein